MEDHFSFYSCPVDPFNHRRLWLSDAGARLCKGCCSDQRVVERSRSHLLSITIHLDRSTFKKRRSDVTDRSLEALLMAVKSQSWRWRSLYAIIPSNFEDHLIAPFCMKNVTLLEHVRLETWRSSSNIGRTNELQFSLSAVPRLTYFDLSSNIHVTFDGPAHNIKHLQFLSRFKVETHQMDLMACLAQCPLLSTLSYHLHFTPLPQTFPTILKHTHLDTLSVRIHLGCEIGVLFHHLILPALTDLVLEMDEDEEPAADWPHLLALLRNSRPHLNSLSLSRIPMNENTLIECLKYTPGLRALITGNIDCTDTTLKAFTLDDSDSSMILCPKLQYLNLGTASRFSDAAMKALILSRWRGAGLHCPPGPGKELEQTPKSSNAYVKVSG
ncbi:hypothetical protein BD410DRAFT_307060 [Rickenella mellea]|uniref:F-box domain-containing protein n=1 Tax=Rickenella mellea TaxID=50990 RepID=A0A4Y7Q0I1_9AGAM|nr:hypothetical protein BD410DRAFT_307060 [Rickenella mellea]